MNLKNQKSIKISLERGSSERLFIRGSIGSTGVGIGLLLIIIAALVFDWYSVLPTVKSQQLEKSNLKKEVADIQQKQSDLAGIKTAIANLEPDLERLNLTMPTKEDRPEMIVAINTIAADAGLTGEPLIEFNNQETDSATGAKKVAVTIDVNGFYDNLNQFLEKIQKNIRPIVITSVAFTPRLSEDEAIQSNQFGLSILGLIYFNQKTSLWPKRKKWLKLSSVAY